MNDIISKTALQKNYWWIGFILVYIILFEFLIPNAIFPKASILLDSVFSLRKDYDLLFNLFYSLSGIYLSLIISFLLLNYTAGFWISFLEKKYAATGFLKSFLFFPLVGLLLAVIYHFPVSVISEYVLWIIFSFVVLLGVVETKLRKVKSEYIESFQSIATIKSGMINQIKWKLIQPEIFDYLEKADKELDPKVELYYNTYGLMPMLKDSYPLYAVEYQNYRYFDTGDRLGYLKALVELGLEYPQFGEEFRKYLREIIK